MDKACGAWGKSYSNHILFLSYWRFIISCFIDSLKLDAKSSQPGCYQIIQRNKDDRKKGVKDWDENREKKYKNDRQTAERHIKKSGLSCPTHILHVDEHHDMMDEQAVPNIANVMVHALRKWPQCRVHWLVEKPIDTPEMWLSSGLWEQLAQRFSMGPHKPRGWPRPDLVSVCTSPAFVTKSVREHLLGRITAGAVAALPEI